MSRKIKFKKLKGGEKITQKINASVDNATIHNADEINKHNKKLSEYTVILVENAGDLHTKDLKDEIVDKIFGKMNDKNQNNRQETNVKLTSSNNDVDPLVKKFEEDIKRKIKTGIYIDEESITRNRSMTLSFSSQTNTPSEKYLGITLDLSYLKKETGVEEKDIFNICRVWDPHPQSGM